MHGIDNIVFSKQTQFQQIEILDTKSYGRCLVLDGKMQSSEVDEYIYHEALVHPAMLTHPHPEKVFIVGGGEGASRFTSGTRLHTIPRWFTNTISEGITGR